MHVNDLYFVYLVGNVWEMAFNQWDLAPSNLSFYFF